MKANQSKIELLTTELKLQLDLISKYHSCTVELANAGDDSVQAVIDKRSALIEKLDKSKKITSKIIADYDDDDLQSAAKAIKGEKVAAKDKAFASAIAYATQIGEIVADIAKIEGKVINRITAKRNNLVSSLKEVANQRKLYDTVYFNNPETLGNNYDLRK